MSSTTSPAASSQQPFNGMWPTVAPYVVPPVAAALAIVPAFRDLDAKCFQQMGKAVPSMTFKEWMKGGLKTSPTVGTIVGTQMVLQSRVEKALAGQFNAGSLSSALASAAVVGGLSAPLLAVFNGQTNRLTARESLRRFSARQGLALTVQETGFVGGLSVADRLSAVMRKRLGDNKAVDYAAAFVAGVAGGLAGHSGNTALTRWQNGKSVDSASQLMWGSFRRARAVGIFSVFYKGVKEAMNSTVPASR
jgi:hypothetical protein